MRPASDEIRRREELWSALIAAGGPAGVEPSLLRALRIYGGAAGIWVERSTTADVIDAPQGVAVGLLHTGKVYADELDEEGVIYHYPATLRGARDENEIASIRAAAELRIPVFVITHNAEDQRRRDVHRGYVEGYDDRARLSLVTFESSPPPSLIEPVKDDAPFDLWSAAPGRAVTAKSRPGSQRFRFGVKVRYGDRCAVCSIDVPELIEAAHLAERGRLGSDDPRNGLPLCASHHRAFDRGLFAIEPSSTTIVYLPGGPDAHRLGVDVGDLSHLPAVPHRSALDWRWSVWSGR